MEPGGRLEEVEMNKSLGVEFRCGGEVGKDIAVSELEKQFDAIFIGLGLGGGTGMNIPGEDLPEGANALDFIERIQSEPLHEVPVGNRVAFVCGGNTARAAVS